MKSFFNTCTLTRTPLLSFFFFKTFNCAIGQGRVEGMRADSNLIQKEEKRRENFFNILPLVIPHVSSLRV